VAADDYALLVGIKRYPGIRDLEGSENDVDEVGRWLEDEEGGAVLPKHVTRVITKTWHPPDGEPARPTLADITPFFKLLLLRQQTQVQNGGEKLLGRRLYIYLSGHGFNAAELSQAALCMADADASVRDYPHLGGATYADRIGNYGMFKEVLLLMDCCRQSIPQMEINRPTFPPPEPPDPAKKFFWGFATSSGTLAAEAEMTVKGVRKKHGIFTALLIDALERCKTRMGGQVCASDVAAHIREGMKAVLGPNAPEPQFQTNLVHDLVLFRRVKALRDVQFTVPGIVAGNLVLRTGQDEPALPEPVPIVGETASVKIEPGIYKALVEGTTRSTLFDVKVVGDPGNVNIA
jgi:hypothetical protein